MYSHFNPGGYLTSSTGGLGVVLATLPSVRLKYCNMTYIKLIPVKGITRVNLRA